MRSAMARASAGPRCGDAATAHPASSEEGQSGEAAPHPRKRPGDQLVQPVVELVVGGEDLAVGEPGVAAAEIGDEAARLADQHDAGGDVPELEVLLPEAVEAARRDPGEIERGRAEAADAGDFGRDRVEDLVEAAEIAMRLVGDAGGDQRLGEVAAGGDAQPPLVEPGAPALFRPEALVGQRIVDQAVAELAPALAAGLRLLDRDRDGEMGDAVEEVGGAVDRIDDPARLGRIALDRAAFLEQQAPVRAGRGAVPRRGSASACLSAMRDEVGRPLAADLELLDLAEVAPAAAAPPCARRAS